MLQSPPDGETFGNAEADIRLSWSPLKPSLGLGANEYYLVVITFKHEKDMWTDYAWTKHNQWVAAEHKYLVDQASDGRFSWSVKLVEAAEVPKGGVPTGAEIALSHASQPRIFVWTRGGSGGGSAVATAYPPR